MLSQVCAVFSFLWSGSFSIQREEGWFCRRLRGDETTSKRWGGTRVDCTGVGMERGSACLVGSACRFAPDGSLFSFSLLLLYVDIHYTSSQKGRKEPLQADDRINENERKTRIAESEKEGSFFTFSGFSHICGFWFI